MTDLRFGIIGCGALGRIHAARLSGIPGVEVTALADPDPRGLETAVSDLSTNVVARSDYRAILSLGLDAVCIASPDTLHVTQLIDALDSGAHVLCEKPLTPFPGELEAVLRAQDKSGKIISLTYPRRYDASVRAMEREIKSGKWGKILQITLYNAEDWITPNRNTWRHDPDRCPGGFFYDASGHQIDTALWVTGLEPVRVFARTDNRGSRVPLAAWGTALLSGGVPITFAFEGAAHIWREQINIHCEGMDFALINAKGFWAPSGSMEQMAPGEPDETADDAFIRLIREGGRNWAPPDDVWPVLRFTRATLLSAERGREAEVE